MPIITGSVGMVSSTNAGVTSFSDIAAPVFAWPIGPHVLVEGRFNLDEFFVQNNRTGPYKGTFIKATQIAQFDYIMSRRMTLVVGQSLVPFNTYNERLSQLWQQNFLAAPLVAAVGTRDSGGAVGAQLRGNIYNNDHVEINYIGWFSKRQDRFSLNGTRAAGDRIDIFFPNKRIEIGTSFARRLQGTNYNSFGAHFYWLPYRSPLQIRSEYAHTPGSQGYWMEASYRLSQLGGPSSILGRVEPLFRMQQAFRNRTFSGDGLPSVDTKIADLGLDYHFPNEVRLNTSYSRRFAQGKDANLWALSLNYRYIFPAWPGRKK
ncbi:MAG: hypothetical protein V4555_01555 [Acidobacteriota bacterium]